jgi:acetate kinase
MMAKSVLVLNCGSSSVKFAVFDLESSGLIRRYDGQIEAIGTAPRFVAEDADGIQVHEQEWDVPPPGQAHSYALQQLGAWLDPLMPEDGLLGVGHRVVHGGMRYDAPLVIDEEVLAGLEEFVPLAPLHQPANLAGIRETQAFLPGVPNIACFDTAFHLPNPLLAELFALPYAYYEQGVRRYGFHGLSYEYTTMRLREIAPEIAAGRVITAHLGNGASMCGMRDGLCVDMTMGFTALDGLPMGTRSGSIDPGVLLYLIESKGMDVKQVEELLYKQSGLLGLSGISNDMRTLASSDEPRAKLAVDFFIYRIVREIGALTAVLGGLDGLVFTAGIGENATEIRERVCRELGWLGLELDAEANRSGGPRISTEGSRVSTWVIPTDEEWMIAHHVVTLLGNAQHSGLSITDPTPS